MALTVLAVLLAAACGGSGGDGESTTTDLPDPCSLVDDATLAEYFEAPPAPEASGSGSFLSCSWSDANANSVLISVATSSTVNRPETCPDCIDLAYGDDGYATSVPLQSTAEFASDGVWYSVTTTGLGDDVNSIASFGEQVFAAASV